MRYYQMIAGSVVAFALVATPWGAAAAPTYCRNCDESPFGPGEICIYVIAPGSERCSQRMVNGVAICDMYGDDCTPASRYVLASGRVIVEGTPDGDQVRRACDNSIVSRSYTQEEVAVKMQSLQVIELAAQ